MKKILTVPCLLFLLFVFVNCQRGERPLVVWSFSDDLSSMIEFFMQKYPDVMIDLISVPVEQLLTSGRRAPDVFAVDSAFIRQYIKAGFLLDITGIYERHRGNIVPFTAEVGTLNGRVYALSWYANPGAMFYRRSLARQYLGTDDPVIIQNYFNGFDTFLKTSRLLSERSNGRCVIVSAREELLDVFLSARETPWVVNGQLVIDPIMELYMDTAKLLHNERLSGESNDTEGLEVFSTFLSAWEFHNILKTITPETSGDWAMIQGPSPFARGGTWIAANRRTRNPEAAKRLIEFIAASDVLHEWQAAEKGNLVSNINVINRIKETYYDMFLGGQNHYEDFAAIAMNVNGRLFQKTDNTIEGLWREQVNAFVYGEKTKAQALADFRTNVEDKLTQ